jgi:hypothetical protein
VDSFPCEMQQMPHTPQANPRGTVCSAQPHLPPDSLTLSQVALPSQWPLHSWHTAQKRLRVCKLRLSFLIIAGQHHHSPKGKKLDQNQKTWGAESKGSQLKGCVGIPRPHHGCLREQHQFWKEQSTTLSRDLSRGLRRAAPPWSHTLHPAEM